MMKLYRISKMIGSAFVCLCLLLTGCGPGQDVDAATTDTEGEVEIMTGEGIDGTYVKQDGIEVIYLAGGCFWGMEKLAAALPGVTDAVSGYANGITEDTPTYEKVVKGGTGFKETVRVTYDPAVISLEQILRAYFMVIDPTVYNRQGNDLGGQYQTGVYYNDVASEEVVKKIAEAEAKKHTMFAVEIMPLINFYDAEEYHQDYLEKNPGGYCHIPPKEIEEVVALILAENAYARPSDEELRRMLTEEQYDVTQNAATERPFTGAYWDNKEVGIYVDITTGQPLFSSSDKYESGCGWPSFSAPIDESQLDFLTDKSHGMVRTEVKSALGDAHLGHIFEDDPESPNGTRYCINSASLRFIPLSQMEEEGYGPYLILFE